MASRSSSIRSASGRRTRINSASAAEVPFGTGVHTSAGGGEGLTNKFTHPVTKSSSFTTGATGGTGGTPSGGQGAQRGHYSSSFETYMNNLGGGPAPASSAGVVDWKQNHPQQAQAQAQAGRARPGTATRTRPNTAAAASRPQSGRPTAKFGAGIRPGINLEERAELAEKLSLDLAHRLRDAELRLSMAETEKAATQGTLNALREFLARKFNLEHGLVHDGYDRYEGFVRANTPSFWGRCRYGNGDEYEGEWADGKPNGFGTCKFVGGNSYVGYWAAGGYHGHGIYRYSTGETYEGEWVEDSRQGRGVFLDVERREYVEVYEDGELCSRSLKTEPPLGAATSRNSAYAAASEQPRDPHPRPGNGGVGCGSGSGSGATSNQRSRPFSADPRRGAATGSGPTSGHPPPNGDSARGVPFTHARGCDAPAGPHRAGAGFATRQARPATAGPRARASSQYGFRTEGPPLGRASRHSFVEPPSAEPTGLWWEQHASSWAEFESNPPAKVRFTDVPWPPDGIMINVDSSREDQRKRLKELLRRWHPDKWHGKAIGEESKDQILSKVTAIFQRIENEKRELGL